LTSGPTIDLNEPFDRIDVSQAKELIDSKRLKVIDVREHSEYVEGHIPGVELAPLAEFLADPEKHADRDGLIFVCAMGQRSAVAAEMAAALGHTEIYNLEGGTIAWGEAGLPIDK
jgi:rhodanese-related sulfurtransferase